LTFAQRKSKRKSKTNVKLNFGLSPDFSVQFKVSEQKAKSKVKVTHCPVNKPCGQYTFTERFGYSCGMDFLLADAV